MKRNAALIALATLATAGAAAAQPAVGLIGDSTLVTIDTATAQVTASAEIAGVGRIAGIDWRPADSQLYAVTETGDLLRIDLAAGTATTVGATDPVLPLAGPVAMDFNPMADRLRLMSGTTNHRVNPDTGEATVDGALHFAPEAALDATAPIIVATAYINAYGKPEATAQYNIDAGLKALVRQTVPNDGTLMPVGTLDIPASDVYAFDVATDAAGANTAWLATDAMLHTLSLENGAITGSWPLPAAAAGLRDLTILPAM